MQRRTIRVSIAVALSLGLAACGGSSKGDDTLSRTQLAAKADAICLAGEKSAQAIDAPADFSDPVVAAAYFEKVVPLNQQQTDDLLALDPADDVKADWAAVIAKQNEGNDLLKQILAKAKARDASGFDDLKTFESVVVAFGAAAKKIGADDCAGDSATQASADADGKISVRYDPPNDKIGADAKQILRLGGTDGVADGFTTSFKLPEDITVHVVNGVVGPHYDPQDRTITLSYGFVNYTAGVLKTNFPELRRDDREFGKQLAAVDAFILVHEFGHAFIHAFDLPVLGREEDAADAVATVFLTRAVDNGAEYAFDAARFFNALSSRQRSLAPQDFFDEHSLDKQRAYSIVCWIAGSSEQSYREVARRRLLSEARQQRCPAEYQQKVSAVEKLLKPHVRG